MCPFKEEKTAKMAPNQRLIQEPSTYSHRVACCAVHIHVSVYVHVSTAPLPGVQKVNCAIWSVRACRLMYASMHASQAGLGPSSKGRPCHWAVDPALIIEA